MTDYAYLHIEVECISPSPAPSYPELKAGLQGEIVYKEGDDDVSCLLYLSGRPEPISLNQYDTSLNGVFRILGGEPIPDFLSYIECHCDVVSDSDLASVEDDFRDY